MEERIQEAKKTGEALCLNQCHNVAVLDIDVKHELDEERKEKIRTELLSKLSECENPIVQTAHGGLHIYCRLDGFVGERNTYTNRFEKVYKSDEFDVDVFVSTFENKRSLIVLPNTEIRDEKTRNLKYKFIVGDENTEIRDSLNDVLKMLKDEIKTIDWVKIYETNKSILYAAITSSINAFGICDGFKLNYLFWPSFEFLFNIINL